MAEALSCCYKGTGMNCKVTFPAKGTPKSMVGSYRKFARRVGRSLHWEALPEIAGGEISSEGAGFNYFYRIFERQLSLKIFLPFPIALPSTLHLTPYTLVFLFRIRFSLRPALCPNFYSPFQILIFGLFLPPAVCRNLTILFNFAFFFQFCIISMSF